MNMVPNWITIGLWRSSKKNKKNSSVFGQDNPLMNIIWLSYIMEDVHIAWISIACFDSTVDVSEESTQALLLWLFSQRRVLSELLSKSLPSWGNWRRQHLSPSLVSLLANKRDVQYQQQRAASNFTTPGFHSICTAAFTQQSPSSIKY